MAASPPVLLELLGAALPVSVVVSPIKDVVTTYTSKNASKLKPIPLVCLLTNSCLWTLFGHAMDDNGLFYSNGVCMVLGTIYCYVFWTANLPASPRSQFQSLFVTFLAMLFTAVYCHAYSHVEILGNLAAMASIAASVYTLPVFPQVISTRNAEPFGSPVTLFLSWMTGVVWFALGYLYMQNSAVWVPQVFGIANNSAALVLLAMYGQRTQEKKTK